MPTLKPGDRVVASSIPYLFSEPKIGDIVLFKYRDKIMVKRIVKIEKGKYYLSGDNKADNLKIKPIDKNKILGKIIFILHT